MTILGLDDIANIVHADSILSCCLFDSDKLNYEKHVVPLFEYLNQPSKFHLYIFVSQSFPNKAKLYDKVADAKADVTLVNVDQSQPGYADHLLRYFGGFISAPACFYLGTDDLNLGHLGKAYELCKSYNIEFAAHSIENHPRSPISGKCATFINYSKTFAHRIHHLWRNATAFLHTEYWNIDQLCLYRVTQELQPSMCYICPTCVYNVNTLEFIEERLRSQPTIIIRTPTSHDPHL